MSGTSHLDDVSCYDLTWASNVVRRSWRHLHEVFAAEGKAKFLGELKRNAVPPLRLPDQKQFDVEVGGDGFPVHLALPGSNHQVGWFDITVDYSAGLCRGQGASCLQDHFQSQSQGHRSFPPDSFFERLPSMNSMT